MFSTIQMVIAGAGLAFVLGVFAYVKMLQSKNAKLTQQNALLDAVNKQNAIEIENIQTGFRKSLVSLRSEHLKDLEMIKTNAASQEELTKIMGERQQAIREGKLIDSDVLTADEIKALSRLLQKPETSPAA